MSAITRVRQPNTVDLTVTATVSPNTLVYGNGFAGIATEAGVSGDVIGLDIEQQVISLIVPSGVYSAVSKGSLVYLVPGNVGADMLVDGTALTQTASTNVPFLQVVDKVNDSTYTIHAIMWPHKAI